MEQQTQSAETATSYPSSSMSSASSQQDATNRVLVQNLNPQATEQSLRDFFSFCGKITSLQLVRSEGEESAKAIVTFESKAEAGTALLLTNAILVDRVITITPYYEMDSATNGILGTNTQVQQIPFNTSTVSNVLADGVILGESLVKSAKQLSDEYHIMDSIKGRVQSIDDQYHVQETLKSIADKAKEMDDKYRLKDTALAAATAASMAAADLAMQALQHPSVHQGFSWLVQKWSMMATTATAIQQETLHKIQEKKQEKQSSEEEAAVMAQVVHPSATTTTGAPQQTLGSGATYMPPEAGLS